MAQRHADQCEFAHDCADCRRVGESVAELDHDLDLELGDLFC